MYRWQCLRGNRDGAWAYPGLDVPAAATGTIGVGYGVDSHGRRARPWETVGWDAAAQRRVPPTPPPIRDPASGLAQAIRAPARPCA